MVSNSKILTVSYGTFSCTLEGFDEPFNTMKSIAEYFRDLAADDRYFGAEPPTPDAEMLHRIAEREIQKRVEARVEEDGVVLRQADAVTTTQTAIGATVVAADHLLTEEAAPAADAQPAKDAEMIDDNSAIEAALAAEVIADEEALATAEAIPPVDTTTDTPEPDSLQADPTTPAPQDAVIAQPDTPDVDAPQAQEQAETEADVADAALNAPVTGSIADKLSRIRAVVDEKRAEGETAFVAADQYAEDQDVNATSVASLIVADEALDEDLQEETPADASRAEIDDDLTDEESDTLSQDEVRALRRARRAQRAERLRELARAEAAAKGDDELSDTDEADAEPEEDIAPLTSEELTEEANDHQTAVAAEEAVAEDMAEDIEAAEEITDAPDSSEQPDAISSVLAAMDTDTRAGAEEAAVDAVEEVTEPETDLSTAAELDEDLDQMRGDGEDTISGILSRLSAEEAETPADDSAQEDDAEAPVAQDETVADDTDEDAASQEAETAAHPEPAAPTLRKPRVIRVRHIKGGRIGESDSDPASQDNEDAMLTPDEEAELMAELAEAEAEARQTIDQDADAKATAETSENDTRDTAPDAVAQEVAEDTTDRNRDDAGERKLTAFDDSGVSKSDEALDRILAETNSHMESSDVTRRRSAIAHLKAAVQARRADDVANDGLGQDRDEDSVGAYRDDLERVVRPRRPGKTDGTARRMPPLVLVSEQRVDEADKPEGPTAVAEVVRPRRVLPSQQAAQDQDDAEQGKPSDNDAGFVDYVEQAGAHELGELLEAAACHTVLIDMHDSFTRPKVMGMVRRYVGDDAFSREEGLRAFGKLLREGRIKRLKRGQFALTDTTRFRPGSSSDGQADGRQSA